MVRQAAVDKDLMQVLSVWSIVEYCRGNERVSRWWVNNAWVKVSIRVLQVDAGWRFCAVWVVHFRPILAGEECLCTGPSLCPYLLWLFSFLCLLLFNFFFFSLGS